MRTLNFEVSEALLHLADDFTPGEAEYLEGIAAGLIESVKDSAGIWGKTVMVRGRKLYFSHQADLDKPVLSTLEEREAALADFDETARLLRE